MKKIIVTVFLSILAFGCGSGPTQTQNANNGNSARTGSAEGAGQLGNIATPTPAPTALAIDGEKVVRVKFASGKYDATYNDSFAGYGTVDFVFDAKAGQQVTVELLRSDGDVAMLSVMRNGAVLEDGASEVLGWTGDLPENGNYTVRVGQTREAARRNKEPVKFTIKITIV